MAVNLKKRKVSLSLRYFKGRRVNIQVSSIKFWLQQPQQQHRRGPIKHIK